MTLEISRNYNLADTYFESFAAFALHLGAVWGFTIDVDRVVALEADLTVKREIARPGFVALSLLRVKVEKGVTKYVKTAAVIKRRVAQAYGCTQLCVNCNGTGKVRSAKSGKPVGDRVCDSTGLNLDSCLVPRTEGSKCRTCKGTRSITIKKTQQSLECGNCRDWPDVIQGCKTNRDTLRESGDEELIEFAVFLEDAKLLETYIPFLKQGILDIPDGLLDDEGDDDSDDDVE